MSIYDKSSLVLIPSGTKTGKVYSQVPTNGDGDFTFTRSSAATRVNADGNIEKETGNLLLQSNSFDTTWVKSNSSVTGGQTGYDGSNDAWLLESSAGGTYRRISQNTNVNSVLTNSIYAKAGNVNYIGVADTNGSSNNVVFFDLANGVIDSITNSGGIIDAKIEAVGGGWYRCSAALTANASGTSLWFVSATGGSASNAGDNVYIQDAQSEQGLVATDYIETTTSAVYGGITDNVPRLDYTDSSCPALLLEPQRTNDVEHSEYFEGSGWGLLNSSLTANDSNSPEGLQNAYSFVPNTTNTTHLVYETITKSAGTYTASCFFKADGYDYGNIRLATDSDAKRYSVTIDLTDGTFASQDTYGSPTSTGYKIEDIGNGWYRLSVTSAHSSGFMYHTISVSNVASPTYSNGLPQFAGDGTKGVLIYGAQLEAGSYATSYIPTYGSSVTRNAESCSKTSATSLIGQTEGTLYVEVDFEDSISDSMFMTISDGTSANRLHIGYDNSSDWVYCNVKAANLQQALLTASSLTDGLKKIAVAYKQNDFIMYINGAQVSADSNANVPSTNRIDIGNYWSAGYEHPVKENLLFQTRLSNEELAALTTL